MHLKTFYNKTLVLFSKGKVTAVTLKNLDESFSKGFILQSPASFILQTTGIFFLSCRKLALFEYLAATTHLNFKVCCSFKVVETQDFLFRP